jgi:hypothetical protein
MEYSLGSSIKVTGVPNKAISSGYDFVTWRENDIEFSVSVFHVRHTPNESWISMTGYPVKNGQVGRRNSVVDNSLRDIWHRKGSHDVPQSSARVHIS